MGAYLELWLPGGQRLWPLDGEKLGVGRDDANALVLSDASVSRLHAVIERLPAGWVLRDLGSRNGTFVNGDQLAGERALRPGDEVRFGQARAVFRETREGSTSLEVTAGSQPAPTLTRREREVLIALCRGSSGEHFRGPATVREIAAALFVTEAAVKQHLSRLYDKFEISEVSNKRARLADEAVRRGAVSLGALRSGDN